MLQHRLLKQVPELAGAPVLPVSALTGSGADRLLPAVMAAYDVWTRRVPTSRLNRWLEKVTWRQLHCICSSRVTLRDAWHGTLDLWAAR